MTFLKNGQALRKLALRRVRGGERRKSFKGIDEARVPSSARLVRFRVSRLGALQFVVNDFQRPGPSKY